MEGALGGNNYWEVPGNHFPGPREPIPGSRGTIFRFPGNNFPFPGKQFPVSREPTSWYLDFQTRTHDGDLVADVVKVDQEK